MTVATQPVILDITTKHKNPNGCNIPATSVPPWSARDAWRLGPPVVGGQRGGVPHADVWVQTGATTAAAAAAAAAGGLSA